MERIIKFLDEVKTFYIATSKDNKPSIRPFSFKLLKNGKLYMLTGRHKQIYEELLDNPFVSILACKTDDTWIRIEANVEFVSDDETLKKNAIEMMPFLQNIYNNQTGKQMVFFYLTNIKVDYGNLYGIQESISMK